MTDEGDTDGVVAGLGSSGIAPCAAAARQARRTGRRHRAVRASRELWQGPGPEDGRTVGGALRAAREHGLDIKVMDRDGLRRRIDRLSLEQEALMRRVDQLLTRPASGQ
ncbi:hypothetical protein [Streptomyces sp. NPDC002851]